MIDMTIQKLSKQQTERAKQYKQFMVSHGIVSFKCATLSQCYEWSSNDSRFEVKVI